MKSNISVFLKGKRKLLKITQRELADKAGVGLRFIRDMEQGKENLELAKVDQVLALFGHEMGVVPMDRRCDDE